MIVDKTFIERLPREIRLMFDRVEARRIDLGRSDCCVIQFMNGTYLKISEDILALENEKERNLWLENRLVAPKVLSFGKCSRELQSNPDAAFLLTSAVEGEPLCHEKFLCDPESLTSHLGEAMAIFHSLSYEDCPFFAERGTSTIGEKSTVCHGDFCLPNIIFDGKTLGFVDLGDMGKGDPWLDYAWCLWSLDYNLKTTAWRDTLLKKLGIDFDEEKYKCYVQY